MRPRSNVSFTQKRPSPTPRGIKWTVPVFIPMYRYWDRTLRSFFGIILCLFFLGWSSVSWAETAPNAELEGILRKIESRHYRWIAIRADVLLFFAKAGDPNAMCGGELLY